jgi:MraZ protein
MVRFVSNYMMKVDAKGRVSIPAPFRALLEEDGHAGLYCLPALDRPAIEAGGLGLRAEITRWISGFPAFSREAEDLSFFLETQGLILTIDPEGRIALPDELKAHAGLADRVVFAGQGHKFQIWSPDAYQARLTEATEHVRRLTAARSALARGGP